MKKSLTAFLALILLAAQLAAVTSCAGTEKVSESSGITTSESDAVTADPYSPQFALKNYDGKTFTIYNFNENKDMVYMESENGDTMDDAVYKRNAAVEDALGINIEAKTDTTWDTAYPTINSIVMSGDTSCDLAVTHCYNGVTAMISSNIVCDWNKIPNADLTMPYWNTDINTSLSICGKTPFASGQMFLPATQVIVFNKGLAQENGLGDIYSIVKDGKWTIDKLDELATKVSGDIDGDGQMTIGDQYGFVTMLEYPLVSLMSGAGIKAVDKNDEGVPQVVVNTEKMHTFVEKVYDLLFHDNTSFTYPMGGDVPDFKNGHTLFELKGLGTVENLRDSDIEFGIIPVPKYDENQENYYSLDIGSLITVPLSASDKELCGSAAEYLMYESGCIVVPAYYDVLLTQKVARDEESAEMLDMVFNNRVYEIGMNYMFPGCSGYTLAHMMMNDTTDLASWYEQRLKADDEKYKQLYEDFELLGEEQ